MTQRYDSTWWSIALPDGWWAERDDDCTTITSPHGIGVLQLSAYQNETSPITKQILNDFALEESKVASPVTEVKFGDFEGIFTQHEENNVFWRKAWLRNNNVLLYATYNCQKGDESIEKDVVDKMLLTLKRQHSE